MRAPPIMVGIIRATALRPRELVRPATKVALRIETMETAPLGRESNAVCFELYPNLRPVSLHLHLTMIELTL